MKRVKHSKRISVNSLTILINITDYYFKELKVENSFTNIQIIRVLQKKIIWNNKFMKSNNEKFLQIYFIKNLIFHFQIAFKPDL